MPQVLTNKYNLPVTIWNACKVDAHKIAGSISCSELIDSPQIRILKKKNDYEVDISEKLDALLGTALHHVLEQSNVPEIRKRAFLLTVSTIRQEADKISDLDETKSKQLASAAKYIEALIPHFFPEIAQRYLFEKTMSVEVEPGFTLYGTFDLYDMETGFIHDYKSCSVYKWIFPESRKQWMAQLNVYAWLLMHEGYKVNGLRINPFYKDWSHSEFTRNPDYPSARIMEVPIELRSYEEVGQYIAKRVKLHRDAEAGNIPDCTGKERWAKATQYAVKEKGGRRAINGSIKETEIEARNFIEEFKHKFTKELYIEHRLGESLRCAKYCPVNKVCSQYKKEQEILKELEKNG